MNGEEEANKFAQIQTSQHVCYQASLHPGRWAHIRLAFIGMRRGDSERLLAAFQVALLLLIRRQTKLR